MVELTKTAGFLRTLMVTLVRLECIIQGLRASQTLIGRVTRTLRRLHRATGNELERPELARGLGEVDEVFPALLPRLDGPDGGDMGDGLHRFDAVERHVQQLRHYAAVDSDGV